MKKTEYACFCGGAVKKNALGYWQCDKCNFACTDEDPEPVIEEGKRIRAQEGKTDMDTVDIKALVDKLEGECDSCEDNGGCSIEVLTREDLRPVLSYAKSKMPTECGYIEPKQRTVLVPTVKLDMLRNDQITEAYRNEIIDKAIASAPIAAIPLKEVPEDCSLCPCQCVGICSVTMTEANYKKRPANCPIVEKE